MNIRQVIEHIADAAATLSSSILADLSHVTPADMPAFKTAWRKTHVARRREVITRLVEMSRDTVEMDFDIIFRYCLSDADAGVRVQAIDGLWESEDPTLIRVFTTMMQTDAEETVQAAAATALGKFTLLVECGDIRPEFRVTLSESLLAAYHDQSKSIETRRRALEAAAPLALPDVREAIRTAYESRDERLTVSAIFAMGRTCNNAWLPVLYREMDNPNAEIRYEAAVACGEIGLEDATSHLMERIHDEDVEVRLAVIRALGSIGGVEATRGLKKVAADPSEAVREAVEQALAEIDAATDMSFFEMNLPGGPDDHRN